MGQMTSSLEKQEMIMLEITLGSLYNWKEETVMAQPVKAVNRMMININSNQEIDIYWFLFRWPYKLGSSYPNNVDCAQ